jgi:hypothetical protein
VSEEAFVDVLGMKCFQCTRRADWTTWWEFHFEWLIHGFSPCFEEGSFPLCTRG